MTGRWADDLDESRSGWNGSRATQKKACWSSTKRSG